jgi:hypothetical protein
MVSEGGEAARADVGRRGGGANVSGTCIGEVIWLGARCLGGLAIRLGGVSVGASPDLVFADRRGGGRLGLGLSSSCSSRADTKEEGEDAFSLLSMDNDMDNRL